MFRPNLPGFEEDTKTINKPNNPWYKVKTKPNKQKRVWVCLLLVLPSCLSETMVSIVFSLFTPLWRCNLQILHLHDLLKVYCTFGPILRYLVVPSCLASWLLVYWYVPVVLFKSCIPDVTDLHYHMFICTTLSLPSTFFLESCSRSEKAFQLQLLQYVLLNFSKLSNVILNSVPQGKLFQSALLVELFCCVLSIRSQ